MRKIRHLEGLTIMGNKKSKSDEMCKINEAYQYLLRQIAAWENKTKNQAGERKLSGKFGFYLTQLSSLNNEPIQMDHVRHLE